MSLMEFIFINLKNIIAENQIIIEIITIRITDSIFLLFTYLEGMIEGAILVLIFLTPMKNLFKSVKGYL